MSERNESLETLYEVVAELWQSVRKLEGDDSPPRVLDPTGTLESGVYEVTGVERIGSSSLTALQLTKIGPLPYERLELDLQRLATELDIFYETPYGTHERQIREKLQQMRDEDEARQTT